MIPAHDVWRRTRRPGARLGAPAALLLLLAAPAPGQAEPASPGSPAPLVISGDASGGRPAPIVISTGAGVPGFRLYHAFEKIYREIFRRVGVPVAFAEHSLSRRAALAEEGAIDGEMARVRAYGDAHPRLVRVEEPIFEFSFALFTALPDLRLQRLEDLQGSGWAVEYRRGILLCETTLAKLVPRERLSDVATTEQGVRKLLAGRTDLYCDLDEFYVQEVVRSPELAGAAPVRRVLVFATEPTYPYLHEKHAALAPRLAEALRQIKAEGLHARFVRESLAAGAAAR